MRTVSLFWGGVEGGRRFSALWLVSVIGEDLINEKFVNYFSSYCGIAGNVLTRDKRRVKSLLFVFLLNANWDKICPKCFAKS